MSRGRNGAGGGAIYANSILGAYWQHPQLEKPLSISRSMTRW